MTFAKLEQYRTPRDRLFLIATNAIEKSGRSADRAVTRFVNDVMGEEDPELLVELVSPEVVNSASLVFLREVLQRDMDGGGIGLRPADKTGSDAVADAAGQLQSETHKTSARPSAPHSETPAEMPVGGGHGSRDTHGVIASPTPPATSTKRPATAATPATAAQPTRQEPMYLKNTAWSLKDIQSQKRETQIVTPTPAPKKPYVAPKERISAAAQLRAKNVVAAGFLNTKIVRGKPLGDWSKGEALALSERMKWDSAVFDRFCKPMPSEEMAIKDFYTDREAENIWKELEASYAP